MRRYLLYAATAAVLVHSLGVLWHVHDKHVLAIHCLLRGTNADGPVLAVDEDLKCLGDRPRNGDRLVRVAGQATPTFVHFNRRLGQLRAIEAEAAPIGSKDAKSLLANTDRALVDMAGVRWVRVHFIRTHRSPDSVANNAGQKELLSGWLQLVPMPANAVLVPLVWFVLELLIFGIGVLVVWKRPGDPSAAMFCTLCGVQVVTFMGAFHWPSLVDSRLLTYPFVLCTLLLAPLMLHFYLLFPRPSYIMRHKPVWTMAAVYTVPLVFIVLMFGALLSIGSLYRGGAPAAALNERMEHFTELMYLYLPLSLGIFLLGQGVLVHSFVNARTVAERSQVKWLLGAMFLAAWPVGYLLYTSTWQPAEFVFGLRSKWMMYLTSAIFACGYAVSITRYKLMQVAWVNRGLVYVAISFVVTALFCLLVGVGTALVGTFYFSWENAVAAGATAMLVVVLAGWLRDRFQRAVDRRFHQEKYQLDKAMRRLSDAVDQLVEPGQLARQLLQSIRDAVRSERGAVYLLNGDRGCFHLAARAGWPVMPETIAADSPLVATLVAQEGACDERVSHLPSSAMRQSRLWGMTLCLPLELEGSRVGLVILGPKQDTTPYSREDCHFLAALAQTTALALESARGHHTIATLRQELQQKVEKIAEQQQRIVYLQSELLSRHASTAISDGALATPQQLDLSKQARTLHGSSAALRTLWSEAMKVAESNSSVLVRGESGTGKELLAEAIHRHSPRRDGPFVQVHCAALSPGLLESELFGHVRGAFTGADRDKVGRFELAHGGTLFLDEIGDISLETQTKLLRVLQQRSFERVGSSKPVQVDVRLITATHQDLEEAIRQGRFREDLFYRLNVISLRCPALRERREDVFPLAMHFLRRYTAAVGKPLLRLEEEAVEALAGYDWPGNVRQLENFIERAVVLAEGDAIGRAHLPPEVLAARSMTKTTRRLRRVAVGASTLHATPADSTLEEEVDQLERQRLAEALADSGGNKAQAARQLGLPRSTLISKLQKYGIE